MGRWDDALRFINASLVQDPLNASAYMVLNHIQLGRGRLEEAEAAIRRTLELNPCSLPRTIFSDAFFLFVAKLKRRWRRYRKRKQDATRLSGSAMAYFALGNKADSDIALAADA